MEELKVEATLEHLDQVVEFVISALDGCSFRTKTQVELVIEEIFVNIASYAYGDKIGPVLVTLSLGGTPPVLDLTFTDEGIPFDPLAKPDPDISLEPEERGIGGLGIFLVKKNVDEISYEHKDGKNYLHIRKNLNVAEGGA